MQAALAGRISNRARLEEVARQIVANSTDKLLEVDMDERMVGTISNSRLHCFVDCSAMPCILTLCLRWLKTHFDGALDGLRDVSSMLTTM